MPARQRRVLLRDDSPQFVSDSRGSSLIHGFAFRRPLPLKRLDCLHDFEPCNSGPIFMPISVSVVYAHDEAVPADLNIGQREKGA
jgi:hypothetical protein